MKTFGAVVIIATATAVAGCNMSTPTSPSRVNGGPASLGLQGSHTGGTNADTARGGPGGSQDQSGTWTTSERNFASFLAETHFAFIELAMLANNFGDHPGVKWLGQQLVDNHMEGEVHLQNIGGPRATSMNASNQATYNTLVRLSGSAFDRQFISALVSLMESTQRRIRQENRSTDTGLGAHASGVNGRTSSLLLYARDLARLVNP